MDDFDKRWRETSHRIDSAHRTVGVMVLGMFVLWLAAIAGICWVAYKVLVHFGII